MDIQQNAPGRPGPRGIFHGRPSWAFAVLAFLVVVALTPFTASAQDALEQARRDYAKKQFRSAAALLLRYLDNRPEDYDALLLLGLSLEQDGDAPQAEKVFREAVRRRPDDGKAHLFVARTLFLQGRFDLALQARKVALEHGADPLRAAYLAGLIFEEQGDDEAALAAFRQAGSDGAAPVKAAALLLKQQRPRDALDELRDAPESDEVRYERARAFAALDDRDAAVHALKGVGDHEPAKALRRRLRSMSAVPKRSTTAVADQPATVRFVERGEEAGLDFILDHNPTADKHLPETMAGGLAVFDANGDRLLDLFFTNGAATPSLEKDHPRHSNRLYLNQGELRFEDVTASAGLEGEGFSIGVAAADYDGDGDIDLFVAGVNRNLLYRNRGDGRFDEVSAEAGISSGRWAVGGGWLDYDNDGRLDLFVANYLDWDPKTAPVCRDERSGVRTYCHPKFFAPQPNQLYRNRGDGTFEDVSEKAGLSAHPGKAMSVAFADVNDDGALDIFTPNDAIPNQLFLNDGAGAFEEAALSAGVALKDDGEAVSAMGAAFGDVNGDGREDLFFTALPGETFPHFRNEGAGLFLDRTYPSRIGALSRRLGGWGIALADFNNDGAVDVMTANSHVMDNAEAFSGDVYRQPNALWLNRGDGSFVQPEPPSGLGERAAAHRGLVVADLDNDGRLDAVVTVLGGRPELWHNQTPSDACWIALRLRGPAGNADAIGAVARVRDRYLRYSTAVGYASSSTAPLHFALADCDTPVTVEVQWPGGDASSLEVKRFNRNIEMKAPTPNP